MAFSFAFLWDYCVWKHVCMCLYVFLVLFICTFWCSETARLTLTSQDKRKLMWSTSLSPPPFFFPSFQGLWMTIWHRYHFIFWADHIDHIEIFLPQQISARITVVSYEYHTDVLLRFIEYQWLLIKAFSVFIPLTYIFRIPKDQHYGRNGGETCSQNFTDMPQPYMRLHKSKVKNYTNTI